MRPAFPYCLRNPKPKKKCSVCGITRDQLIGKGMPGLYKNKCHKCYVLVKRYGKRSLAQLVRATLSLQKAANALK